MSKKRPAIRLMVMQVEQAIDGRPDIYRAVLIMREIEGMTTAAVAEVLHPEVPVLVNTRSAWMP